MWALRKEHVTDQVQQRMVWQLRGERGHRGLRLPKSCISNVRLDCKIKYIVKIIRNDKNDRLIMWSTEDL